MKNAPVFKDWDKAKIIIDNWKEIGFNVVFTNGCFDILHAGHIQYLQEAREMGDKLIIGLNADSSVQKLKGKNRPINSFEHRAVLLTSLRYIDLVIKFEEETPLKLISLIKPDVLVKGGDYKIEEIVGAEEVKMNGGEVKVLRLVEGLSTSRIIEELKYLE